MRGVSRGRLDRSGDLLGCLAEILVIGEDRKHLNCTDPANLPKQIMLSHEWYTDHYAATLEQYLTHISK